MSGCCVRVWGWAGGSPRAGCKRWGTSHEHVACVGHVAGWEGLWAEHWAGADDRPLHGGALRPQPDQRDDVQVEQNGVVIISLVRLPRSADINDADINALPAANLATSPPRLGQGAAPECPAFSQPAGTPAPQRSLRAARPPFRGGDSIQRRRFHPKEGEQGAGTAAESRRGRGGGERAGCDTAGGGSGSGGGRDLMHDSIQNERFDARSRRERGGESRERACERASPTG